jgi:hypothetical protein
MERLQIILEQPQIYAPGEMVTGHMYIRCKKPIKARNARIKIKGAARTSWTVEEYG